MENESLIDCLPIVVLIIRSISLLMIESTMFGLPSVIFNANCDGILLLISASVSIFAQDFSVHVESTYLHGDYIVPLKPGATKTFEVKVKNNRSVSYTVSIRKYAMGNVQDWMSFSTESMAIQPSQTGTFQFTITVPSGTNENVYTLLLVFDGVDSNNNTVPIRGNDQVYYC